MHATIMIIGKDTNCPALIIRRSRSFKTVPTNAGDLNATIKTWIIGLSNLGYSVRVVEAN